MGKDDKESSGKTIMIGGIPTKESPYKGIKAAQREKMEVAYANRYGRNQKYNESFSGKFQKFFGNAQRVAGYGTGKVYGSSSSGIRNGRRGRPVGSYADKYKAYGGVYEYRKALNQKLRLERIEAMRRNAVTPQQERVLREIAMREQARRNNPENRIIPDTAGLVPTKSIHQEIDDAANIIP